MSKHTPGPWHVEGHATGRNQTVTDARRFEPICALVGEQSAADAQLIAAAPELLAALKRVKQLTDVLTTPSGRYYNMVPIPVEDVVSLRAAIAKAEGNLPPAWNNTITPANPETFCRDTTAPVPGMLKRQAE